MNTPVSGIYRNRLHYTLLLVAALLLGLASRKFFGDSPFIRSYAGDAIWALMVFFGFGLVFNQWPIRTVALTALAFSFGIECSQLYHAPWIDELRHTRLGGLVLGFSFLWTDLLCYVVGVAAGVVVDWGILAGNGVSKS